MEKLNQCSKDIGLKKYILKLFYDFFLQLFIFLIKIVSIFFFLNNPSTNRLKTHINSTITFITSPEISSPKQGNYTYLLQIESNILKYYLTCQPLISSHQHRNKINAT